MSTARKRKPKKEVRFEESSLNQSTKKKRDGTWSAYNLIPIILAIRLVNAFTTKTFFQADEFFQALEPAHHFIYGYGYLTWEWKQQLRSSIHPLIYALGYKLAGENKTLVHIIPKIINAIIATIGEYNLYKFVLNYCKHHEQRKQIAATTLILSLLNPFNWYVFTRSFSNNLETVLTIVALRYWPWDYSLHNKSWYISLAVGFTSCIIRPTNVLIWFPLGLWLIANSRTVSLKWVILSITEVIIIAIVNTGLDYYFYQQLTIPIYNFLEFNVFKNLSIFYGTAPWHFYIVQAIPLMMMLYLPFMIYGFKITSLTFTGIVYLIGFSLIDHKEFRFIYPIHPIMLLLAARGYVKLRSRLPYYLIFIGIMINFCVGFFFSVINERGVIDIVKYLDKQYSEVTPTAEKEQIKSEVEFGFITPCHSTPWQSYFHNPELRAWFLSCEPPLHLRNPTLDQINEYRDQSDQFYDSPREFLQRHLGKDLPYPDKIIVFEPLESLMNDYLHDYHLCQRFFNSYFHWDRRRSGDVLVYCNDGDVSSKRHDTRNQISSLPEQ
ncbi:glycosyl phosphatidylinositol synthesis [Spathaspora passalidarum NRRL Y-27907]|uniref:Mannosyltransferase n=1 Tax=Spathaspora passalidarum (strain NRRL Y-27907 / 11-Y1) TaxID=619300 RepID=G3ASR5_SPAPN|nr:glycosyl phosphatidylinositol synthesis [Spathaspora passalidarum NRRL Y-27907]EGW31129.1 glycosyl phosphatidylinositol synthesis [Spathaspora passalidarum NRRL Y-27907]